MKNPPGRSTSNEPDESVDFEPDESEEFEPDKSVGFMQFVKVEGAGNDFILVDGNNSRVDWDKCRIESLCDRRRGIGADGLLYITPRNLKKSGEEDLIRVHFWNPDGGTAAYCGNGARCVAAYLFLNRALSPISFQLEDVPVEAKPAGPGRFQTTVPVPAGRDLDPASLPVPGPGSGPGLPGIKLAGIKRSALVTVGVPHLVLLTDAEGFQSDVMSWGPSLSTLPEIKQAEIKQAGIKPERVNVNLLHLSDEGWRLRTFERGVENETLACGSGITAAAWSLLNWNVTKLPVTIQPTGGDKLMVSKSPEGERWFLEGPARIVYRGRVHDGR